MTPDEIETYLLNFNGSEEAYKHWSGRGIYTEGIKWLADTCGAYWLIDEIFLLQLDKRVQRDGKLQEFQLWVLKVKNNSAVLECCRDDGDVAFRKKIEYTDFPLDTIRLYFECDTLFLVSER